MISRTMLVRRGFTALRPRVVAMTVSAGRRLNSSGPFPNVSPEQAEEIAKNPLIQKLSGSPKSLEALQKTAEILRERGYGQSGKSGVMEQIRLLSDSAVREQLTEMKKTLDDEGIELKKEDVEGLMGLLGFLNK